MGLCSWKWTYTLCVSFQQSGHLPIDSLMEMTTVMYFLYNTYFKNIYLKLVFLLFFNNLLRAAKNGICPKTCYQKGGIHIVEILVWKLTSKDMGYFVFCFVFVCLFVCFGGWVSFVLFIVCFFVMGGGGLFNCTRCHTNYFKRKKKPLL